MKIVRAQHAGFCSGVRRCIAMTERLLREARNPVVALGQLLHNEREMERLANLGLRVAALPEQVPPGADVIIRTHGIGPGAVDLLRAAGCRVHDGTCPIVQRSQTIATTWAARGCHVVIYGDTQHPEIQALVSHVRPDAPHSIVASVQDVPLLRIRDGENVILIAQTTKRLDSYEEVSAAMRERFGRVRVFNTICRETIMREESVREVAGRVQAVIVVGGKGSANTRKLAAIAEGYGVHVVHVNEPGELAREDFGRFTSVGVVSGASTPSWLIEAIIRRLEQPKRTGGAS
jgi:4-hydroxy-3-methylbut-2-enyl diphosphate reductase